MGFLVHGEESADGDRSSGEYDGRRVGVGFGVGIRAWRRAEDSFGADTGSS